MNDREINLILTALRYFQSQAVGNKPASMLTGYTSDRIDELCQKLNSTREPYLTSLSPDQVERLRQYLSLDCQSHLEASGKWHLDAGKLDSALAAAGVCVSEPETPLPRVIVVVEGGVVSAVFSDRPLNVDVLDHDNWEATDRIERQEERDYFAALLHEIEEGKLQDQVS